MTPSILPDGIGTEPATDAEARAAYHKGRKAGADFVILARETDENGEVDEQTLLVFAPEGNPLYETFAQLAAQGMAIRCSEGRTE